MTKFCFFPFTHVTAEQKRALGAFFREVKVLTLDSDAGTGIGQPREDGAEMVSLVPVCVAQDRAAALDQRLAEYLAWAQLHRGNERNLKHLLKETPYYKMDSDVTSLKSQIAGGESREEGGNSPAPDPGLFLKLAQTLDRENEAIEARLKTLDRGKDFLLAELKGELEEVEGAAGAVTQGQDRFDPGTSMPDKRMEAWAELAEETGVFSGETPVLVTTSPAVMTWLTDNAGEVINGLDIDSIKVHENGCGNGDKWFQALETLLDQITTGRLREGDDTLEHTSECCDLSGRIQVRLFPGGDVNRNYKIPGGQLAVCLVGLNS